MNRRTLAILVSLFAVAVSIGGLTWPGDPDAGPRILARPAALTTSPSDDPFFDDFEDEADDVANSAAATTRPSILTLDPLFTDHMVLQRDMAAPVWGVAQPGQTVTLAIADQRKTAKAEPTGKWSIRLDPLPAGGPHEVSVSTSRRSVVLRDVLVGDVWVCSGQSNMELLVRQAANAKDEIAQADHPRIRINSTNRSFRRLVTGWAACTPETAPYISAVGYFFARDLQREIDVPIGLLVRAVGGTHVRQWTPREGAFLQGHPELAALATAYQQARAEWDAAVARWNAWKVDADLARTQKQPVPRWPTMPPDPRRWGDQFERQIVPAMPFAIRGVLWYQGETDARMGRCEDQHRLLPLMIQGWRKAWGQGDFPFLTVQLANDWGGAGVRSAPPVAAAPPEAHHWPWVREAQAATLALPNTGLAVTIDLGGKIHFANKQDVGRRLSLVAQALVYDRDIAYRGPVYQSMQIQNGSIRISFGPGTGPLVMRGESLTAFEIAGEDRTFHWAQAAIDGDTVMVRSPSVPRPVAARYAWTNNPRASLYNEAGLPAAPFRTDDWPRTAHRAAALAADKTPRP